MAEHFPNLLKDNNLYIQENSANSKQDNPENHKQMYYNKNAESCRVQQDTTRGNTKRATQREKTQ